ncbi:hypothetical protein EVAR_75726_1 [Eumeta japonica]|uniref:Uncharacterized protein n=1 Tax=Eumeta variegata TaxID=151549 RepID=A0A4C1T746_EUMVA|nr:hypothetical protein EVAR_75726_1 [Eumeta japonica]
MAGLNTEGVQSNGKPSARQPRGRGERSRGPAPSTRVSAALKSVSAITPSIDTPENVACARAFEFPRYAAARARAAHEPATRDDARLHHAAGPGPPRVHRGVSRRRDALMFRSTENVTSASNVHEPNERETITTLQLALVSEAIGSSQSASGPREGPTGQAPLYSKEKVCGSSAHQSTVKTNQTSPNSMELRRLITEFLWPPSSSIIRLWLPHSTKVLAVRRIKRAQTRWGCVVFITEFLWPPSSSIIRLWLPYSTKVLGKTNQTSPNSMGRC